MNVSIDAGTSQVSSERALIARVIRGNPWWFIAGLMVVGAYLRLANLGDLGIHSDEDISLDHRQAHSGEGCSGVSEWTDVRARWRVPVYHGRKCMAFRALRIRHTFARRAIRTADNPTGLRIRKAAVRRGRGPVGSHTDHFLTLGNRGGTLRALLFGVRFLRPAHGFVHLGVPSTFGASRWRNHVRRAGHLQYHAARARIRDRSDVPDPTAPDLGHGAPQSTAS